MNVSANIITELRDEADVIQDRRIKMHTHSREAYRSESMKSKKPTTDVSMTLMLSIFAIGYL